MKLRDNPKIKALEWHLKFLSEDLENMNELDFRKLVVEADFYFMNPIKGLVAVAVAQSLPMAISTSKRMGKERKDLQVDAALQGTEKVDNLVPSLWDTYDPPSDTKVRSGYPWRKNLRIVQETMQHFMKGIMEGGECIPETRADIVFVRDSGTFRVIYDPVVPKFADATDPAKLVEEARLSLIFALDGIPTEGIKTCRECRRYFLHLSKKPKFFCDYRCTVKFTSRRRREKDPEGYRASQREIMRKKYRERKAKKLGRPVDKIRFQGRRKEK